MTKINQPLVSIITPGWNGKSFVYRLLDSILLQTYTHIEYIYVDDGSTDGTKDVVLSYKSKFEDRGISFQYIYKENGGVSTAVEKGLQYVNGEYLCWPEYDDWLTPDSIEKKVKYLEEHPDCAVVTSDAWLVSEKQVDCAYGVLSRYNPNRFDRNHFVQALLSNSVFTAACQMCRMSAFDATHINRKIYPSPIGPNWQILLPMYYKYCRGFIQEPLCYYLVREDSISNGNYKTFEKRKKAIEEFIKAIKNTLITIDMPTDDLHLYQDLLDEKYALDKLQLGYESMDREYFNQALDYFVERNKPIPKRFHTQQRVFKSNLLFSIMKISRKVKHFIKC